MSLLRLVQNYGVLLLMDLCASDRTSSTSGNFGEAMGQKYKGNPRSAGPAAVYSRCSWRHDVMNRRHETIHICDTCTIVHHDLSCTCSTVLQCLYEQVGYNHPTIYSINELQYELQECVRDAWGAPGQRSNYGGRWGEFPPTYRRPWHYNSTSALLLLSPHFKRGKTLKYLFSIPTPPPFSSCIIANLSTAPGIWSSTQSSSVLSFHPVLGAVTLTFFPRLLRIRTARVLV